MVGGRAPADAADASPSAGDASSRARLRHELRTPINQIIGYSEMLEEEAVASGQTQFVEDLQRIGVAARTLLSGIDGLLAAEPAPRHAEQEKTGPTRVRTGEFVSPEIRRPTSETAARILVVDDNEMNRDMLSRRLGRSGFEVATAEDGYRALDLISQEKFDLVLLDIMMPGMSGYEVLRAIREKHSASDLPVVMATAKGEGEDIVSAFKLGANDYVTKPIDYPVALARIETQLSLKRAMEEVQVLANQLERRNKFIRKTFGRYLSEEVVESLLDRPEGLKLGGEKRTVTVVMSDLRGFSSVSESLAPEQVVTMLNNYLAAMTEVIARYQGTIDEFIGDAILTLFGAPVQREDDAERAVACAVAMQQTMEALNRRNEEMGLPETQMGIAVNTGEVVVGNIGSQKRSKYGVVGSQVNLAGRIESYTVGGQILVSQSTVDAVGPILNLGEKMSLGAKGFKDPVVVYDVRGIQGQHNLFLGERREELKALVRGIPLRVCRLEDKHLCGDEIDGAMVSLSLQEGEVRCQDERSPMVLAPLNNVRIRLTGLNGVLIPGDLYAKVTGDSPGAYRVHFTSIPPEVKMFIRSTLANEVA